MSLSRKEFIQKTCMASICFCGFGSIALAKNNSTQHSSSEPSDQTIQQDWISNLLTNLSNNLSSDEVRRIVKSNSIVHYNNLKMDEMLSSYIGNLDGFISFISEKWDWIVEYDKESKTIIANENKSYCVCPMVNHKNGVKSSAICYCSEGFAEKMFTTVAGVKATAEVISSVIRGDKNCIYKIKFA